MLDHTQTGITQIVRVETRFIVEVSFAFAVQTPPALGVRMKVRVPISSVRVVANNLLMPRPRARFDYPNVETERINLVDGIVVNVVIEIATVQEFKRSDYVVHQFG